MDVKQNHEMVLIFPGTGRKEGKRKSFPRHSAISASVFAEDTSSEEIAEEVVEAVEDAAEKAADELEETVEEVR